MSCLWTVISHIHYYEPSSDVLNVVGKQYLVQMVYNTVCTFEEE